MSQTNLPFFEILIRNEEIPNLKEKICAILVDYRNFLFPNQDEEIKKLKDLQNIEAQIREQGGKIIFTMAFCPYHEMGRAAVQLISNIFHYDFIVCPQEVTGGALKDADKVDAHILRWIKKLEPLVDQFVVVSGDGDFCRQIADAWRIGKNVTVVSGSKELSNRFRNLKNLPGFEIKEV